MHINAVFVNKCGQAIVFGKNWTRKAKRKLSKHRRNYFASLDINLFRFFASFWDWFSPSV
jgi:hypothetical protein